MFLIHIELRSATYMCALTADPPWSYEVNYAKLQGAAPYPTMTTEELKTLPVGQLAANDSLILMWATNPKLPLALEVMQAWGFQ